MAVVHSLERIPPKWTVLLHTFAGKWQNPLSKASLQACIGPTVVCYWSRQAAIALR